MRIALVAGEASGDTLGAALMEALRRRFPDAQFAGVAGPKMKAAGCAAWTTAMTAPSARVWLRLFTSGPFSWWLVPVRKPPQPRGR